MDPGLAAKHAERMAIRARFEGVFDEALALFYEVDPAGINFGVNPHEYMPEVCTVLPRMDVATSLDDVVHILDEEFERWFGSSYTVEPLARLLWPLWLGWKEQPTLRNK